MFFIYQILITILIILSPIIIFFRILKKKEDVLRFREKFCFFSRRRAKGKLIWFHGSSVGEIMSIIPLIKEYENYKNIDQILITSSTLSSSRILKKYNFKKVVHQFFPIDYFFFSEKFLNFWKPTVAIFIESEIWPSMFKSIKKNKIKLILLNARITKKSFSRWKKFDNFSKKIFELIDVAYPQNLETKKYLSKLNVKKIKTIGNLKFIQNPFNRKNTLDQNLINQFQKNRLWTSASTHPSEEIFIGEAHKILKVKFKKIISIIIPRHIERVDNIISQLEQMGLDVVVHSSKKKINDKTDIYLVDTYGEAEKFYKISPTVFLGGSIVSKGGQNPLEPVRHGSKILHGPNYQNFNDIYKLLNKMRVSKIIKSPRDLISNISFVRNMGAAKKIKSFGEKIFRDTIRDLNKIILNEIKKTKILG